MTTHNRGSYGVNHYDISTPQELTAIAKAVGRGRMVLRFYRDGCPHCDHMVGSWLDFVRRPEYKTVTFISLNTAENSVLARHYNVNAVPTFVCIDGGIPRSKFSGADVERLRRMIETGSS